MSSMKRFGRGLQQFAIGLGISLPLFSLTLGAAPVPEPVSYAIDQSCVIPESAALLAEEDVNLFVTCGGFFD